MSRRVFGPTGGSSRARRGGKKRTRPDAHRAEEPRELVLHHVGERAHHQQLAPRPCRSRGRCGTMLLRQVSSPCVNVVSMPLPE